tara:strand:+ start:14030 stop:14722 length:693 start_codon:yes stop_codon:yes gene_type:complete
MTQSKEVSVPQDLFPQELPEAAQGSGRGNEDVGSDVARPMIKLLQQLSPELNSARAEYVDSAKVGDLYNPVTGEIYDRIFVANMYYYKNFTVFKKQDFGGGFEGAFDTRAEAADHLREMNADQFDIVETAHHICALINVESKTVTPIEMLMSSTKLPVSDRWNTNIIGKIKDHGGDRFSTVWQISHVMQTKNNNTWANFKIDFAGFTPADLHAACAEAYENVAAKQNKAA